MTFIDGGEKSPSLQNYRPPSFPLHSLGTNNHFSNIVSFASLPWEFIRLTFWTLPIVDVYHSRALRVFVMVERVWGQRRVSCVTDFHLTPFCGYFIFTPRCLVDVTPWTRRPKKNYTKDSNRQETKTFFFSFISWVQQPFNRWGNFPWIQLKWLNPPVKVFKNTLIVSWYIYISSSGILKL